MMAIAPGGLAIAAHAWLAEGAEAEVRVGNGSLMLRPRMLRPRAHATTMRPLPVGPGGASMARFGATV